MPYLKGNAGKRRESLYRLVKSLAKSIFWRVSVETGREKREIDGSRLGAKSLTTGLRAKEVLVFLPASDSPLRSLFSIEHDLVPIGTGSRRAPFFRDALITARKMVAEDTAIKEVHSIAVRVDGSLILFRVGARGGHRCLWNFSSGKRSY